MPTDSEARSENGAASQGQVSRAGLRRSALSSYRPSDPAAEGRRRVEIDSNTIKVADTAGLPVKNFETGRQVEAACDP